MASFHLIFSDGNKEVRRGSVFVSYSVSTISHGR